MSLFSTPEEHAANAPSTWNVVKLSERSWALQTATTVELDHFTTKTAAEAAKVEGHWTRAYAAEGRWYAGATPAGWKSWEVCKAEQERNAARWAS